MASPFLTVFRQISPSTNESYCMHIRNRIIPTFGHRKLEDLKPIHFMEFVEQLKNDTIITNTTVSFNIRVFKNILKRALRHTLATLLLEAGEQVKTVQTRLGHSNMNSTMNIYAHTLKEADEQASNKLENMINKNDHLQVIK